MDVNVFSPLDAIKRWADQNGIANAWVETTLYFLLRSPWGSVAVYIFPKGWPQRVFIFLVDSAGKVHPGKFLEMWRRAFTMVSLVGPTSGDLKEAWDRAHPAVGEGKDDNQKL